MDKPLHVKLAYQTIWIIAKKAGSVQPSRRCPTGGEPLWNVPKRSRDVLSGARKAKSGVKQAAPANYRTRVLLMVASRLPP